MPKERPDEHLCAISQEPMVDVVAADGFTYERSQIEERLQNSRTAEDSERWARISVQTATSGACSVS